METFSVLLDICAGKSPVTREFPSQRPVTQIFYTIFDLRLEQTVKLTILRLVNWDAIGLIITLLEWNGYVY